MQVLASKVRKGQKVWLHGVKVEVTRREKWSAIYVKVHYNHPAAPGHGPFKSESILRHNDLLEVG